MEDDVVQLVERKQPMPPHGRVLGGHSLERAAVEIGGEDDVDDVLPARAVRRRDRVDERHRPLERQLVADAELLLELSAQPLQEAFAGVDTTAGQQPVLLSRLLVAAEQEPVAPAKNGRDANPWLAGTSVT